MPDPLPGAPIAAVAVNEPSGASPDSPQAPEGSASLPAALPVVETFHSLQGEGLQAGRSAFFIRLAGCTVGCPWCDTKHSWPAAAHGDQPLHALADEARSAAAAGAAFVVITGGEPLHHRLDSLCSALSLATASADRPHGLPLHLETSGVDPLSGRFDWITLSPKRHRPPTPELLAACDELKVVVHEAADLAFAEAMAQQAVAARSAAVLTALDTKADAVPSGWPHVAEILKPDVGGDGGGGQGPALLLQPGWNCRPGQELAVEFVRQHPAWRLSLQSHKWLGVR
jgi:7-carboxy-7-deazaguanine synthase